ncbi:hypothetical protein ACOMHN_054776 [Nucella lapillus]
MAATLPWCFGLLALMCVFQAGEGSGRIEIKMDRFECSCSDNAFFNQDCDPYFIFCIDKQRTLNIDQCFYKRARTGHYHTDNSIEFGRNMKGVSNPMLADVTSFPTGGKTDVVLTLEAWDKDSVTDDDRIVTMTAFVSYTPAASRDKASWKSKYKQSGTNHMWFFYRFYCDAYYYTDRCDIYCKARDNSYGHYTCIEGTGEKKCIKGWTGVNCNTDIDECSVNVCYHNATCTNLPGSYQCTCSQGYAGHNCDLIDTLCHSAPCQNGGACTGTLQQYSCTCPFEWKGTNCETQVDFCETNPCQNNGTCYATLGGYTCECTRGWTGTNCTTEVNACESSPCQNGGNCTKQPAASYTCSCPVQYEGDHCQTMKNPCVSNPCQNSGTCNQLTYDAYNCSCVYGWDGDNCETYITVAKDAQKSGEVKSPAVDYLPIVIGILAALVPVIIILILCFCIRRRRQKEVLQQRAEDMHVVHVAGRDGLAFRNAIYDQTNSANFALEKAASRPPLPVPCPAPCEDVFTFTKPKVLQDPDTEQGAVGGWNPYQEVDMDMKGAVGGGMDKLGDSNPRTGAAGLDTRTMAGNNQYDDPQGPATNPYADFEELKRRSVARRGESGFANSPDTVEQLEEGDENPYHDLDDLVLYIQNSDPHPLTSDPDLRPPLPSIASLYDTPRSFGVTSAGYDVSGVHDLPSPGQAVGVGYMAMEGSAEPEPQLERLDSSEEEEEEDGANQEDIVRLRQEALNSSNNGQSVA